MTVPAMIDQVRSAVAACAAIALRKSCVATSAAAPPPMPLNSATICGIAVMRTVRAA